MSVSEGGLMTFTVTRSGDAADAQTIDFATSIGAGDTAEANDFTGNSGTLTFAPGVTSQTFTVQTTQDGIYEGGETFTATLSNNSAGSTIADGTATG
ncbi:Calx-beta domain-containing protein, partial [Amphritea pacifica]